MARQLLGTSRNNYLFGTVAREDIYGFAGNDYLRGFEGNDVLIGGFGADRFVFERTLASNGLDDITDFEAGIDTLDFSLVGFSRGVLSQPVDNIIRIVKDAGTGATVQIDRDGGADSFDFETWATMSNMALGATVNLQVGAQTLVTTVKVFGPPEIGGNPNTSNLTFDIGNGDRNGSGVIDVADLADNDELFDDPLAYQPASLGDTGSAARVWIGDRVKGLAEVAVFEPGVTRIDIPDTFNGTGDDAVDNMQFEVYYGSYASGTNIFTVTSTPDTTADPTTATHTMILYDNDTSGSVDYVEGLVFTGVYAEEQWYITDAGTANAGLNYDTDGISVSGNMLDEENVIYGGNTAEVFDGSVGIDIIYANGGNDRLYGGEGSSGVAETDWLVGGLGGDTFIVTDNSGVGAATTIDWVKDLTVDDKIIFARYDNSGIGAVVDGTNVVGYIPVQNFSDRGSLDGLGAATLQLALEGYFDGVTQSTNFNTVYQVAFGGKDYLVYDAGGGGDAFGDSPFEWVVEITGVVGVVSASQVLVNIS